MQKIKKLLQDREALMELVRYIIAGVLTTLLSLVITYGGEALFSILAPATPEVRQALAVARDDGLIKWLVTAVNSANNMQVTITSVISWIISVLFAFWINRGMVFRVKGGTGASKLKELTQFAGSRIVSFLLFELGVMLLLKACGVTNLLNRLIVLVLVTIFNYVASKFWVFAGKAPTKGTGTPEAQPKQLWERED